MERCTCSTSTISSVSCASKSNLDDILLHCSCFVLAPVWPLRVKHCTYLDIFSAHTLTPSTKEILRQWNTFVFRFDYTHLNLIWMFHVLKKKTCRCKNEQFNKCSYLNCSFLFYPRLLVFSMCWFACLFAAVHGRHEIVKVSFLSNERLMCWALALLTEGQTLPLWCD